MIDSDTRTALLDADAAALGARTSLSCRAENLPDHGEWDAFIARTLGGDVVQSSAWGRFKQASGMEIHRLVVRSESTIVGGAQLIVRRLSVLGAVAYLPYGPVVSVDAPPATAALLARALRSLCGEISIRAMFVQPPENGEVVAAALRGVGFEPSETECAPTATIRIDIHRDPSEILMAMSPHTRKDIRRSWREPLRVRVGTREDLDAFYDLYCRTADRQHFTPQPRSYFDTMWDTLRPDGLIQMFLCDLGGTDVAGSVATSFGNMVTGRFVGFDPARLPSRMRPTESLVWARINWARANGFVAIDFGGIDRSEALEAMGATEHGTPKPADPSHKLWFGGVPLVYPEPLQLIPNPALRAAFRTLNNSPRFRALRETTERLARAGSQNSHTT